MRPIQVTIEPVTSPFVCAKCGMGRGDRDWFTDFGISTELNHDDVWVDGVIYFCNSCMDDLIFCYYKELPRVVTLIRNNKIADERSALDRVLVLEKENNTLLKRLKEAKQRENVLRTGLIPDKVTPEPVGALDSLDASLLQNSKITKDDLDGATGRDDSAGDAEGDDSESATTDSAVESSSGDAPKPTELKLGARSNT